MFLLISTFFSFLDMELFQTDILKKEYNEFVKKTLPETLECNYCNKDCCKNHYHFEVNCHNCRAERCLQCKIFNNQMDCLMKAANNKARSYIYNFVLDFFNLSSETLERFYNIKTKREKTENINEIVWKLKAQHGTKYKATTLAKTMKFTYTIRKRRYM